MTIQIFDCEQGSIQWHECRRGIATASRFADLMAKGEGKMRLHYLRDLAGEIITGQVQEGFRNSDMDRGHEMEAEARLAYAIEYDQQPQLVGFVRNGDVGCSPDSLIGDDGLLEIKTKIPALLIEAMERGSFPPEHKAQCQGALWVTERDWIDIACYWPRMPLVVYRATRDEEYIANLQSEVARFNDDLAAMVERVRRYGMA